MECKSCKEMRSEIEDLRQRLCTIRDSYSRICEELWTISHKKREEAQQKTKQVSSDEGA